MSLWLRRFARAASDYLDLAWTLTLKGLVENAPRAKGRLLDVGCGDLPYKHLFLPHVSEYIGVEHEASFNLTTAAGRADKPDILYDGKRLPFEDASFDTVMSIQVLEHTPEPAALVKEMARVLKPGGLLLLSAPFSFRLHEEPHDYFRYTPHGLRSLCEAAGFNIERIDAQGGLWGLMSHKTISYLSLRVLRVGALAAALGKMSHEGEAKESLRWYLLPFIAPLLFVIAFFGRLGDRLMPEPSETLNYLVLARKA